MMRNWDSLVDLSWEAEHLRVVESRTGVDLHTGTELRVWLEAGSRSLTGAEAAEQEIKDNNVKLTSIDYCS